MRKKLKKLNGLVVLAAVCVQAQAVALDDPMPDSPAPVRAGAVDRDALLGQARFWQSQGRDDLSIEALDKLLRVLPADADVLAELALAQARANRPAQARATLARLRKLDRRHPVFARVATLNRLAGADKARLRQVRMLARAGRTSDALAAMRALFPQGMPTPELELEYWQLVGSSPDRWAAAHAGLAALARAYPDNAGFQVALADHMLVRHPDHAASLQLLARLARLPGFEGAARPVWRRAMLRLTPTPRHLLLIEQYLSQEKSEDTAVANHLSALRARLEQRRRLLADPYYQARVKALALFNAGKDDKAEGCILDALRGRPDDADLLGALGVLRMRQGFHAEARAYFLRASRFDRARAKHWRSMASTAHYWNLLREASDGASAAEFALVKNKLREALLLDAAAPHAWVALGKVYAAQKRPDAAEQAYRRALMRSKADYAAVRGLVMLHLGNGQELEAARTHAVLKLPQRRQLLKEVAEWRADRLQAQAEQQIKEGNARLALRSLLQAAQYAPDNAWIRYDLARLHAAQGRPQAGQALFDDLLRRLPDDASARYAAALYQSGLGQDEQALLTLERVAAGARTEGMTRLQRRLWVAAVAQNAQRLLGAGERGAATALLARTAAAIGDDADLALDVAAAQANAGDAAGATALLERFGQAFASAPGLALRHARLLDRMGADAPLSMQVAHLSRLDLDAEQAVELAQLRKSAALRRAAVLQAGGNPDEALRVLRAMPEATRNDADLLAAEAGILRALGQVDHAAGVYARVLEAAPDDPGATIKLIETLIEGGRHQEALARIDRAAALPNQDADFSAGLVAALIALERYDRASVLNTALIERGAQHARSLLQASELAELRGETATAIRRGQQGLALQAAQRGMPGSSLLSRLRHVDDGQGKPRLAVGPAAADAAATQAGASGQYGRLATMLDANTAWLAGAADLKSRAGSAGKSALQAVETPLEWRRPLGGNTRLTVRAESVRYDAGTLDPADREFATFGSALLCDAPCAGPLGQRRAGVALSAAIDRGDLHADIGTTPLGFPVRNVVGGVTKKGDLGPLGYTAEVSRRAVASSVLSYAGAVDPRTGQAWGGVTSTGARLGLSLDQGGTVGAWSSLGRYRLAGKNVQANRRTQAMAGVTVRMLNDDDRLMSVGLTGMLWRHDVNAGEYTFGHGGYYSPERYKSLSLPVTFAQRFGRWSYAVRAALAVSRSATGAADYFPTDPALQARADVASAANFSSARHDASQGGGRSHALSLAAEYQLTPRLFLGGRAELDRSPDYAPNHILLYFRYSPGQAAARPVNLLPQPVFPSSQN